jgi:hypothetical protein
MNPELIALFHESKVPRPKMYSQCNYRKDEFHDNEAKPLQLHSSIYNYRLSRTLNGRNNQIQLHVFARRGLFWERIQDSQLWNPIWPSKSSHLLNEVANFRRKRHHNAFVQAGEQFFDSYLSFPVFYRLAVPQNTGIRNVTIRNQCTPQNHTSTHAWSQSKQTTGYPIPKEG